MTKSHAAKHIVTNYVFLFFSAKHYVAKNTGEKKANEKTIV